MGCISQLAAILVMNIVVIDLCGFGHGNSISIANWVIISPFCAVVKS